MSAFGLHEKALPELQPTARGDAMSCVSREMADNSEIKILKIENIQSTAVFFVGFLIGTFSVYIVNVSNPQFRNFSSLLVTHPAPRLSTSPPPNPQYQSLLERSCTAPERPKPISYTPSQLSGSVLLAAIKILLQKRQGVPLSVPFGFLGTQDTDGLVFEMLTWRSYIGALRYLNR